MEKNDNSLKTLSTATEKSSERYITKCNIKILNCWKWKQDPKTIPAKIYDFLAYVQIVNYFFHPFSPNIHCVIEHIKPFLTEHKIKKI